MKIAKADVHSSHQNPTAATDPSGPTGRLATWLAATSIEDIPPSASAAILRQVNHILKEHFDICHSTIQFEDRNCEVVHGCVVPPEEMVGTASGEHGHHHHH